MIVFGARPDALGRLRVEIASRAPGTQFVFCRKIWIWL